MDITVYIRAGDKGYVVERQYTTKDHSDTYGVLEEVKTTLYELKDRILIDRFKIDKEEVNSFNINYAYEEEQLKTLTTNISNLISKENTEKNDNGEVVALCGIGCFIDFEAVDEKTDRSLDFSVYTKLNLNHDKK